MFGIEIKRKRTAEAPPVVEPEKMAKRQASSPGVPGKSFIDLNAVNFGEVATAYRWNIRASLFAIQDLFERDSYCSELVFNAVDFVVGNGVSVDFNDDVLNKLFGMWRWSATNREADIWELQRFAMLTLYRDGDMLFQKCESEGDPGLRLYPLEARYLFSSMPSRFKTQAGIEVHDDLTPKSYHYEPIAQPVGSLNPNKATTIPAEEVVHVFRTEWANQARGLSWLRRSYEPLRSLRGFDTLIVEGAERAIRTRGFLGVPNKYLTEAAAEEENDAETEASKALLVEQDIDDFQRTKMYPNDVIWVKQESSGITSGDVIAKTRKTLTLRAARGLGMSGYSMEADFTDTGVYASRQAYTLDLKFYDAGQRYLKMFMRAVVDWWVDYWKDILPELFRNYKGYVLNASPFPYADPLRDAQALRILLSLPVTTPQQLMRDHGLSVSNTMMEIEEWAKFQKRIQDEYGVDIGKAFGTPHEEGENDDAEFDKVDKMDL